MWVLYIEWTNFLRMRVQAHSFTNRLHGKAAEWAVLTEITVLKLKNPSSIYIYGKIEVKELEKPSLFNG